MFENKSYFKIKTGTERNFGLVFATIFAIIGLYPLWHSENVRVWAFIIATIFLLLTIVSPKALVLPNQLWLKLGMFIGAIVSPIIMGIIFFLTVTPTGIIMRLLGKDLLRQKFDKSTKSYWIKRKKSLDSMKNQF